ncbi:hypothetical protein PENSPDRAFT_660569 [Peniophora sp. CONT]|nr:hypothetical protein PENSPDRAFT_660569 [Peniophora sp. CONT]
MLSNFLFGRGEQPSSQSRQKPTGHELLAEEMETRLQDLSDVAKQCEAKEKELRTLQRSLTHRVGEARALYVQLEASTEEKQPSTQDSASDLKEEIAALREDLDSARRENARMSAALADRERACQHAQRERDDMVKLLSQRSAELDAAQAFLPSTESITDTEVIQLLDSLNYEIVQAATSLSDSFEGATKQLQLPPPRELDSVKKSYERRFGRGIARLLLSIDAADPVLCLQLALQGRLTDLASGCVHQWCFANSESTVALRRASDALIENEPQHIAVRWSGLARKYVRVSNDSRITAQALAGVLAEHWADVLSSAGFGTEGDVAYRKSLVLARCGKHLEDVAKLILELNDAVGQKVTRGWMRCLLADDGAPFDASTMEADIQETRESKQGETLKYTVLCTTGLGLEREETGAPTVVLSKPKVVAVPV